MYSGNSFKMRQDILDKLVTIVSTELDVKIGPVSLGPDTRLFADGLELDSFAVVEMITRIEDHYDFEFLDTDFIPENFVDLATLGSLVQSYVSAGSARA